MHKLLVEVSMGRSFVRTPIFEGIRDSAGKETNLTWRILRTKWPAYGLAEFSNKVAALNIFSSAFSIKEMVKMKMGECGKEGDFFVWGNMMWTLTGSAELEALQNASKSLCHCNCQSGEVSSSL